MAACSHRSGQAFFDGTNPVLFCRNALWFMAAPFVIRRSRQRQGVVIRCEAKRTAALIFVQSRRGVDMAWEEGC